MKHDYKIIKLKPAGELLVVNVPNQETAYFGITARAGHIYSPKGKEELAHLLEHVMFSANQKFPKWQEFAYETEKLGAYTNAYTRKGSVSFIFISGVENMLQLVDLGMKLYVYPAFPKNVIENEKEVIRRELEPKLENPYEACADNYYALVNKGAPDIRKRVKSLDGIKPKDLENFFKEYFTIQNTKFLLAGSLNKELVNSIVKNIECYSHDLTQGEKAEIKHYPLNDYKKKIISENSKKAERVGLDFAFINPTFKLKNSPQMKIFHALYNDGTFSRIYQNLRELGLSYGLKTGYSYGKDYSEFYISDTSKERNSLKLFDISLRELKDLVEGNFTQEELERAKGYLVGSFERSYQTAGDLASWYSSDFADDEPLWDYNEYMNLLRNTTKEELKKVVKDFFENSEWTLSILGRGIKRREKDYRKTIEKYFK